MKFFNVAIHNQCFFKLHNHPPLQRYIISFINVSPLNSSYSSSLEKYITYVTQIYHKKPNKARKPKHLS